MKNPEISILLLNMFKTLIDNNSNILKITQGQLWEKISNQKIISALILRRTRHGVRILMENNAGDEEKERGTRRKSDRKMFREI